MTNKDTREDIFSLAELAEATGGVTLETVGQVENLKLLTPERIRATWEKVAAKFARPSSIITPLERFLKWSVADRSTRTISPFSRETVSEGLKNRLRRAQSKDYEARCRSIPRMRAAPHILAGVSLTMH